MASDQNSTFLANPTWQSFTVQTIDQQGNVSPQTIQILPQSQFNSYLQKMNSAISGVNGFGGAQANIRGPLDLNSNPITGVTNSATPAADEALSAGTASSMYGQIRGVVQSPSQNYSIQASDGTILCNGSITATLPDVSTIQAGTIFIVIQWASGQSIVATVNNQTMSGLAQISLPNQYAGVVIQAVGKAWAVIASVGFTIKFQGDGTVYSSTGTPAAAPGGTITPVLQTQSANTALLGPTTGGPSAPTFRALHVGDLPAGVATTLTGTTGSIGGSLLTVGQQATGTATIAGSSAAVAAGAAISASAQTSGAPGAGFVVNAYLSGTNTITVAVTCVIASGTPTASVYNVSIVS